MNTIIFDHFIKYFTMENITAISVIVAVIFGVINIYLIRRDHKNKQDQQLFNIVTNNINEAISLLESLDDNNKNDSYTWQVVAELLSAFHNIGIEMKNINLRKCYCANLHSYILRLSNIINSIDDYRFYFGHRDYKNRSVKLLQDEVYVSHDNISSNALHCFMQFISLFMELEEIMCLIIRR